MQRGHRVVASGAALVVVASVVALPVITGPHAAIHAVSPLVTQIALTGIDPAGLSASSAPVAEAPTGSPDTTVTPAAPGTRRPAVTHVALAPAVVTSASTTPPFSLVAVDWTGTTPPGTTVQVRVHENGAWSSWSALDVVPDHGPDAGSAEALAADVRSGTEPLMTSPGSDGVQVRVDSDGGVVPTDAKVTLIDPRTSAADAGTEPAALSTAQAAGDPLRPAIITRAQWGADESLRDRGPIYTGPIQVGFVHHTAATSNYTPAQSTAQVRALYAYFTLGLHYSDIAYNFLVDRYGRLYEGRAGGMDKNVLGGHTAGFNQNTFAVSVMGNFQTYNPTRTESNAIVTSISRLMAWKLALNHRNPLGSATLVSNSSAGTSRFAAGTRATVPVISGHRDIGSTACPGKYIEQYVPRIRSLTRALMGTQLLIPATTPSVTPYGGAGTRITATATTPVTWKLEVFSVCQDTPVRVLSGTQRVAGALAVAWNQKASDGTPALPGTYRLVLSASSGSHVAYPVELPYVVAPTATSPLGPCDQAGRLVQTERYAAAVEAGRLSAPSSTTIVLASGADSALPEALVAAPLAAVKGAPRLLTAATSLPASVVTDIKVRRTTTAYVVGTTTQITPAVETQLRSLGVTTIVRLAGVDHATLAAAVADEMGVGGRAVAVSFDANASLDLATAAAADAAVTHRPLVVVTGKAVPSSTSAVLSRLGITSVAVAASAAVVPDAVIAAISGGARVTGIDDVAAASAMVDGFAPSASRVAILPVGAVASRAVAASTGRPLLLSPAVITPVTTWLARHGRVAHALAAGSWRDSAIGALARAIATRPATVTPPPAPTPVPTSSPSASPSATASATATPTIAPSVSPTPTPVPTGPPIVPTSFSFSGSGFGHGVGMSQYGARGMALEGSTGAQIVQHYYSGTTVTPVADTMNIRVNLLHLQKRAVFRSEALVAGGGGIEVTVTGFAPVVGGPTDTWTVTPAAAGKVTVTRSRAGVTIPVGTGTYVVVHWAGTRVPGAAGTGATVLNLVTSSGGFATAGHRYRYGWLDFGTTSASRTTLEAVNSLRIHDEYLLGIGEVSSSWPAAALQAQVLAARSYALARYGTGTARSACRCHVDNGRGPYHDQTFVGWSKESGPSGGNWRSAVLSTLVSSTKANAVLSAGKPITAFYFSASGGATQASQDVWFAALPYAASVDDHWSLDPSVPWSSWVPRVRTQAQVAAAFGLRNVVRIDLSSRTAAGGVRNAVAWSSTGVSATIRGEVLRSRLALPSTWVWRAVDSTSGAATTVAARTAAGSTSPLVIVAPLGSPALIAVASNLSVQRGWPLLIVSRTTLPAVTRAELVRRKATRVYVVGTPAEIPPAIVALIQKVVPRVGRFSGATDSDISATVAGLLNRPMGTQAMVAAVTDPVSATIAGSTAAASGRPLLLVPGGATGSATVSAYLTALAPARTNVVGTTSVIPASVLSTLRAGVRVAGADAADTSVRVLGTLGVRTSAPPRVVLATPAGFTTAMLASPRSPMLVTAASLPSAAAAFLQRGVSALTVQVGVSAAVVAAARRA